MDIVTRSPHAHRLGVRDLDAALASMSEYVELMDELNRSTRLPTLVLGDCGGRWPACYREIAQFLGV